MAAVISHMDGGLLSLGSQAFFPTFPWTCSHGIGPRFLFGRLKMVLEFVRDVQLQLLEARKKLPISNKLKKP